MQEQNFEKQVQQKMDELSLTPSAPVWQKVQSEIRPKKEKRRLVLWMASFLLLLLAGGWWLFYANHSIQAPQTAVTSKPSNQPPSVIHQKNDQHITQIQPHSTKHSGEPVTDKKDRKIETRNILDSNRNNTITVSAYSISKKPLIDKPASKQPGLKSGIAYRKEKHIKKNNLKNNVKEQPVPSTVNTAASPVKESETFSTAAETNAATPSDIITSTASRSDTAIDQQTEEEKEGALLPVDNQEAQPKLSKKRQWLWTAHAAVGSAGVRERLFSGLARSLEAFSNAASNPGVPPVNFNAAAPSKNGIAYSFGAGVKTALSKRLAATAGISYSYFSTKIRVGHTINRDTVLIRQSAFVVNSFFQSGQNREYTNRYHFMELPVALEWKLHQKLPLYLHTGISLSRMLSTNALIYDRTAGIYYEDKQSLQRNQLQAFGNLNFRFINRKKISMQAGPYLQYGLSELQKGQAPEKLHLFSSGLRTSFTFL